MSWNIHAGICPAGRYDLHRVIALVRRHAPDLIALQEAEGRNRHDGEEPFHLLREALGGQAVEAATMREAGGCYGHMLISRLPLRDAAVHDASLPGREPRAVISAVLDLAGGTPAPVTEAVREADLPQPATIVLRRARITRDRPARLLDL